MADAARAAARLSPADPHAHLSLGDALFEAGALEAAGSSYQHAIQLDPKHGEAYLAWGELARETGSLREAVDRLRYACHYLREPWSGSAWLLLGATQREAGAAHEAVRSLQTAVRIVPADADVHWQLADAHDAVGGRLEALRSCRAAVVLRPDHVEAYSSLARLVASEMASEAGSARWALLARWSFRRALRLRPAHPETLHNLGEFLEKQGDSERAVLSFSRAVGAAPANFLHRLSLGENLQRRCRVAEAFAQYQRAALLAPHSSRVQAHARLTHPETDAVHAEPPRPPGGAEAEPEAVAAAGPPSLPDLVVEHAEPGWEERALRVLQAHGAVVVRRLLNRSVRPTCNPRPYVRSQPYRHRHLRPPPSTLRHPLPHAARCVPPCSRRSTAGLRAARVPHGAPGSHSAAATRRCRRVRAPPAARRD